MWIWIFLYANVFILSGWNKLYKVIKLRAQVVFFCVSGLSRGWDLQAIQFIIVHTVLFFVIFWVFFRKSEAFSLCGFATPFFFLPNSRSPITRSNLEFSASNNCLMDPHVYTAWHWHPDSVMKVPNRYYCFMLPPCLKKNRREKKKKEEKREKLQALFSWYSGEQWMVPLFQPPVPSHEIL